MTGSMLLITTIQFLGVIAIIIGLLNEKKLVAFEDRLGTAIGKFLRKHIRRYYIKKQAKNKQHLKAVVNNSRPAQSSTHSQAKYIA